MNRLRTFVKPSYLATLTPATKRAMSTAPTKHIFAPGGTNDSQQAQQYTKGSLTIDQLDASPFTQFDTWFKNAKEEEVQQKETVKLSKDEMT